MKWRCELLPTSSPKWTTVLDSCPHDIYHTPELVELTALEEGRQAGAILVESKECSFLIPISLSFNRLNLQDACSPYGYAGALLCRPIDEETRTSMTRQLLRLLDSEGIVSLFVRLHPILDASLDPPGGTVVHHGHTVSMDLSRSDDAYLSDLASGHRYEIRRAVRNGYVASRESSLTSYREFVSLYTATMERLGAQRQYFFSERYFSDLLRLGESRISLIVVRKGGELAAAAIFFRCGHMVHYHLSASSSEHRRSQPTKLLLDYARVYFRELGAKILHLGGGVGGTDDALFAFKQAFSRDRHVFRTWRVIARPYDYSNLCRLAGTADDDLNGFFPCYNQAGTGHREVPTTSSSDNHL